MKNIQNGGTLQHHGILGQRWGVRRTENQLSSGSKKSSGGKNSSKKTEVSKVKSLSDAELRQRINRMQMEKQYSQLTKKDTSAGQKFVTDILSNATKQTATKYMTKGIDKMIENISK